MHEKKSSTPRGGKVPLLVHQVGFRSGKQLRMWCSHLPFSPLSPTHGIFCCKRCLSAEKVCFAFGKVSLAGERKWSCSRRQPALLRAGQQAARRGGRGWLEMRMPPGMWSALLGSQATGVLSPPARAWHLSDRSRLCRVMAMIFSLVSSLGIIP